jgi:hypothetical protein
LSKNKKNFLIISEKNEPISPLYISNLNFQNRNFATVLHLTYYKLLIKLGMNDEKAYGIISNNNQFIDFTKCDVDYQIDAYIYQKSKSIIYKKVKEKFSEYQLEKSLILSFPKSTFEINIVGDDFFSTHSKFNIYSDVLIYHRQWLKKHKPDIFIKYFYLKSISSEKLDLLDNFYNHFKKTFFLCKNELGIHLNLKNLKNIFKVLFPSIYILYKNNNTLKSSKLVFDKEFDSESNDFLYQILSSISLFYTKIETNSPKKDLMKIFEQIYLLYKISPNRHSSDFFHSIQKILTQTPISVDFNKKCIQFKGKLKDENLNTKIGNLAISLFHNSTYFDFLV